MIVICRLQELAWKNYFRSIYVFFIDLTKTYDSVVRTPLWTVLDCFGVTQTMISIVCQFNGVARECVRLDDGVRSGWFAVKQGFRQGCVLASLLFNISFAVVINVAYTRFNAEKNIVDALVPVEKKTGIGGRGGIAAGVPVLATSIWGMLQRGRRRNCLATTPAAEEDGGRDRSRMRDI